MTVNTTLAGLSQTPASNGPDGGADPPSALDDALRYHGAFIAQLRDAAAPIGGIIMYSGLAADLTANWKICDGTAGTPDLRDRFIICAGTSYALGTTGGSKDAIVVAHTHSVSGTTGVESAAHTHGVIDPGHAHTTVSGGANSGTGAYADATPRNNISTSLDGTGISLGTESANHTHDLTATAASTGASGTDANLPPWYALAYIKRVS